MFLLESVEGGAQRGRYSMIGLDPDIVFRSTGERAEINRRALDRAGRFLALPRRAARGAARAARRIAHRHAAGLPPMSAGVFGYLGYDMVRRMERLAPGQARSDRRARGGADPPDGDGGVRRRRATRWRSSRRSARRPGSRARAAYESGDGAARRGRRRARSAARPHGRRPSIRWWRRRRRLQHDRGRIQGDGRAGEGLYRRRRRLPDRAVAALHQPLRPAGLLALPGAAAGQSVALSLLPRFRRLPDRRLEPGNPGAGARRQGGDPPDRRHPLARQDARARTRRWRRNCSPTRRSAPSI